MSFCKIGKVGAVIVAAGNSSRMKSDIPKVYMLIAGKPVLLRTCEAFEKCSLIDSITVVAREADTGYVKDMLSSVSKLKNVVAGGKDRRDSVRNGVEVCTDCDFVAIHDGARPLVTPDEIERVCRDAMKHGAAALSAPCKDTVKICSENSFVVSTPDRSALRNVYTPQVFNREEYIDALALAGEDAVSFTDDCQLFEAAGRKVYMSSGSYSNIKITTPEDIDVAGKLFERMEENHKDSMKMENLNDIRTGHGYDVHRLVKDRKLIIGGVEIPHTLGLLGHSDADVLLHAVSDALLGAAALGDIGHLFPDNDPQYEGISSLILLRKVCEHIAAEDYRVGNIDAVVIAQKPKLMPYINEMRKNIAEACGIDVSRVSVKATTEEGLGFSGSEEGIAAHAVCLIYR